MAKINFKDFFLYTDIAKRQRVRCDIRREISNLLYSRMHGIEALNLALASEMTGDLDAARKWLDEAGKRVEPGSDEDRIYKYLALKLEERRAGFPHLQIQMRRFGNNLPE